MKIVVSGARGFIGSRLTAILTEHGHECVAAPRSPKDGTLLVDELPERADAVVNLGGESVVGLWTAAKKRRILSSRVRTTERLAGWAASAGAAVFVSSSAVGYYGDRGDEIVDESSGPDPQGKFRAQVCLAWEEAALRAGKARVVLLRTGNVLDPSGGYMARFANMYRRFPAIGVGDPAAWMPWISLDDACGLIELALTSESVSGPLNVVAPVSARQGEFANLLAQRLGKRIRFTLKPWMLRPALGGMADTLLESQRIVPAKAASLSYEFRWPELEGFIEYAIH